MLRVVALHEVEDDGGARGGAALAFQLALARGDAAGDDGGGGGLCGGLRLSPQTNDENAKNSRIQLK